MAELRGAIYARRSKDLDTSAQVKRVRSYLSRIQDSLSREYDQPVTITVPAGFVFRDEGQSGANFERTEYTRLRQTIAGRGIDVLAIHATDRLGRTDDPTDMLLERRNCMQHGVRVWAEIGDYEVTAADEMTVIRYFLESVFAARERRRTRERTQDGQQAAWERDNAHWAFGGRERYGYTLDEDKHLTEDPDQARILRQIFGWAIHEGLSGSEIANRLNLRGVIAPQGSYWWARTIHRMLADPAYAGSGITITLHDKENERVTRHTVPIPALIDPSDFQAAQRVLKQHSRPRGRTPAIYPLTGLMRCGLCGRPFTGFGNRGHMYYRCQGRSQYRQLGIDQCGMHILPTHKVEPPVWDRLRWMIDHPDVLTLDSGTDERERIETDLEAVKGQLERKLQAQVRMATGWNGSMHPRAMETGLAALTREIGELERRVTELEYQLLLTRGVARTISYSGEDLDKLPAGTRAALARELVHSIDVEQPGERQVKLTICYFPVSLAGQNRSVVSPWTAPLIKANPIILSL